MGASKGMEACLQPAYQHTMTSKVTAKMRDETIEARDEGTEVGRRGREAWGRGTRKSQSSPFITGHKKGETAAAVLGLFVMCGGQAAGGRVLGAAPLFSRPPSRPPSPSPIVPSILSQYP